VGATRESDDDDGEGGGKFNQFNVEWLLLHVTVNIDIIQISFIIYCTVGFPLPGLFYVFISRTHIPLETSSIDTGCSSDFEWRASIGNNCVIMEIVSCRSKLLQIHIDFQF
jgi:hypothetical protein